VVVNTHGTRVIDLWTLNVGDVAEFQSMAHTRCSVPAAQKSTGSTAAPRITGAVSRISTRLYGPSARHSAAPRRPSMSS
jgi:hypothetical protein